MNILIWSCSFTQPLQKYAEVNMDRIHNPFDIRNVTQSEWNIFNEKKYDGRDLTESGS